VEKVADDVRNGLVSREAARRDYGVVIGADFSVDDAATVALRAAPRGPMPFVTRERAA